MNWFPGNDSIAMKMKYPQSTARGMSLINGDANMHTPTSSD
jgi:hypothetical protein